MQDRRTVNVHFRVWAAIAAGSVFGLFAGLRLSGSAAYDALLRALGIPAFRFPFLDTHGVLASLECYRAGVDVYAVNPCDVIGRPHDYSPVLLRFAVLPVTVDWRVSVGIGLVVVFLLGLLLLPAPRSRTGVALMFAAGMSPPVVFAMERGNLDLLIFACAAVAASLSVSNSRIRSIGYGLAIFCAALKYYPVMLLALAVRERFVRALLAGAAAAAVLCGIAVLTGPAETLRALSLAPKNGHASIYLIGARNLPLGLQAVFGWSGTAVAGFTALVAVAAFAGALALARALHGRIHALGTRESSFLLAGSALFVGCFFLAQNAEYRAIHLLLALPGVIALSGRATLPQRIFAYTAGITVLLLWQHVLATAAGPGRLGAEAWFIGELCWWWTVAVLSGAMLAIIQASPAMQTLRAALDGISGKPMHAVTVRVSPESRGNRG